MNAIAFGTDALVFPRSDPLHMDTNIIKRSYTAAGFSGDSAWPVPDSFCF
jgi:hypothetical protein